MFAFYLGHALLDATGRGDMLILVTDVCFSMSFAHLYLFCDWHMQFLRCHCTRDLVSVVGTLVFQDQSTRGRFSKSNMWFLEVV